MLTVQDLAMCEEAEQATIQPQHDTSTDSDIHAGNISGIVLHNCCWSWILLCVKFLLIKDVVGRRDRDGMVVGFTTAYAINIYHLKCCEFESRSGDTTLCDKVCQSLTAGQWFSPGTPVSSTNKTDRHDITEILLKVALNTIDH